MRFILSILLLLSLRDFTTALKCPAEVSSRLDCAPDKPNDKNVCSERHCCYSETNEKGAPKCFFPSDYVGYQVKDVKHETNKVVATLERQQASGLPKDVKNVQVVVTMVSDASLRIKVTDVDHKRFEAPQPKLTIDDSASVKDALYAVDIKDGLLTVTRKASQKEIFATDLTKLIFADQFMQLKSRLSSELIYGLGEHKAPLKKSADWRTYPPFDDGEKMDIFIKNASDNLLVGKVWNRSGKTVFPDFSHPNATSYWTKLIRDFHNKVAIDGSWNDMNEISNSGVDGSHDGCPKNELENPPYLPGGRVLHQKTICMSAKQAAGSHYNVHNLYALFWAIVTNKALREVRQKRPFIISRASSPGLGVYAGHWDGDTFSTYDQMAWTVPSILNFNMFGIPLVGGDICGFQGSAKNDSSFQHLCARWHEVGAFYPFARNHNTKKVDQDPVALGSSVVTAAKNALTVRYSLLPYLYTLFYYAEAEAQTVARPLFMEFPEDSNAYSSVSESQFLWGSAFMVIPVLKADQTSVHAYFPAGMWYHYTLELDEKPVDSSGQFIELSAPIGKINTAIRGGHVVPVLPPKQTTTEMRKEKFGLIVSLDKQQTASGSLFWDDGDSLDTVAHKQYSLALFDAKNGTLHVTPKQSAFKGATLGSVDVLGVKSKPTKVTVNGNSVPFEFGSTAEKVSVKGLSLSLFEKDSTISWH